MFFFPKERQRVLEAIENDKQSKKKSPVATANNPTATTEQPSCSKVGSPEKKNNCRIQVSCGDN